MNQFIRNIQYIKSYFSEKSDGFTLIEILIVMAVLAIISASLFMPYNALIKSADLKTTSFKIIDVLQTARARTIASDGAKRYGVHFELNKFVFFQGAIYDVSDLNNIIYTVPSSINIAAITLNGGGVDVIFDRITGETFQNGTIKVQVTNAPLSFHDITILSSGRTDAAGEIALTPVGTNITDSRHVHFLYSQDVNPAITMTLDFPGYMTQNINFQTYLSGGKFDWSGTISVGGVNQVLRVHTHFITPSEAKFSVTRDLRYNDRELNISLDGQEMVKYTTAGVVSQGSSVWVGTPITQ